MIRVATQERDLALRLSEAEATIEALLTGQIDAVVDSASRTPVLLANAQEALRLSEERYRRIVETTTEGIWLTDAAHKTTFMNPRMAQILSCDADDALGRTPFEFLDAAESDRFRAHLDQPDAGHVEIRFTRCDGTSVWTLLHAAPVLDQAGLFEGSLTMVTDVSERRRAEQALAVEHDRAQDYLNNADVFLVALDTTARIQLANRYACAALGWRADELIGRDWVTTCIPERLRAEMIAKFSGVLDGAHPVVENPIVTRAGVERIVEWHNTLQHDAAGLVTGIFCSGTDVTERHLAVEALRTAEERMRFALQSTNVGIWDQNYSTGALEWSEILEAQYGLEPGSFDGRFETFLGLIHPEDRSALVEIISTAIRTGADFKFHHRGIRPDGSVRWFNGSGRVVRDADGKPLRAVGISQDVTERHVLETQYLQSQRMEAVGRLAGGVAHDFNNILTVILTCGEFLLESLQPLDPARAEADEIVKAGRRAASLTRQLLMFSRQQVLAPKVLDLSTATTGMEGMLRRVIGEDVELTFVNDPALGLVRADPGSVEQVIMNLVVNARDAMPTGGQVTIATRNELVTPRTALDIPGTKPGPYVVLSVRDTGLGMDPATRTRIFEPFYTTKGVGRGTGLGLSTVFGIVQQSGGAILVESGIGAGTTFHIYLPCVEGESLAEPDSARTPQLRGGETIMLVEDEQQVRTVARTVLERHGYRILEMRSAAEAIRYCEDRSDPIDLLLTDVVMPSMSGPELGLRLLALRPGLKVLCMSGYTDDSVVLQAVLQGTTPFLQKPFTAATLTHKVRNVLAGQ